jgi:L-amino acid N-acyltransferase YncA
VLQQHEVTPVWGTGAHNAASLAVARTLGFTEVATLTYLVRHKT